ncbi:unnamed protein product [Lathyrus sativus]|nr:unnamed protein product [Lathyrus sativus]
MVKTNNGVVESVEDVKETVRSFYNDKYVKPESKRPLLEGCSFNSLSEADVDYLEALYSKFEIKAAVWSCDGTKKLGSDGFNFVFIKKCWIILKEDIIWFVKYFHPHAYLHKAVTSSFLTLIPKDRGGLFQEIETSSMAEDQDRGEICFKKLRPVSWLKTRIEGKFYPFLSKIT